MSSCAACGAASPVRPLRAPCGHVLCGALPSRVVVCRLLARVADARPGRCAALRVCSAPLCPACGGSLRQLETAAAASAPTGVEQRRVRYGHAEMVLRVRVGAGETTRDAVAATFGIPRDRLKLLAAGRLLGGEEEARAAQGAILALGTPAGAQLAGVPAWRTALSWLTVRAAGIVGLFPPAAQAVRGAWRLFGRVAGVAAQFALSLLVPSHAPPVAPPPDELN